MHDMSQTRGSTFGVSVGASATEIVSGSEKRIGILFIGPATGRITLGVNSGVTLDNGLTISSTSGLIELTYERWGNLIRMPWWAIADQAGRIVGVGELLSG
jgi:hypothetical protein